MREFLNAGNAESLRTLKTVKSVHSANLRYSMMERWKRRIADNAEDAENSEVSAFSESAILNDDAMLNDFATPTPLTWEGGYAIARALRAAYPTVDLTQVSLRMIYDWTLALPDFDDDPALANDDILHSIYQAWFEEIDAT